MKFEYNEILVVTIHCAYKYNQMVINDYIVTDTFRSKINLATRGYFNARININISYFGNILFNIYLYNKFRETVLYTCTVSITLPKTVQHIKHAVGSQVYPTVSLYLVLSLSLSVTLGETAKFVG